MSSLCPLWGDGNPETRAGIDFSGRAQVAVNHLVGGSSPSTPAKGTSGIPPRVFAFSGGNGLYSVYILYSQSADRYYVGHTGDIVTRLNKHNSGVEHGEYTPG